MDYRNLGGSGLMVSAVGLGTNQFGGKVDLEETKNIIHAALDSGVNFIDTADVYQGGRSEEYIGKSLEGKRSSAIIATKFFFPVGEKGPNDQGASRLHIMDAVHASLDRLGTDYIDLYQVHRWDPNTLLEETLRALDDLVRSGKVRYIGASNFTAWQLVEGLAVSERVGSERFVSIQPHYHMFERGIEEELIPACQYHNIGILPYFPLAGGLLTGKYKQDQPPPPGSRGETSEYLKRYQTVENFQKLEQLNEFSSVLSRSLTELAHAWLLAQPQISSVISGATKSEHVEMNVKAFDWKLSDEELSEVAGILKGD